MYHQKVNISESCFYFLFNLFCRIIVKTTSPCSLYAYRNGGILLLYILACTGIFLLQVRLWVLVSLIFYVFCSIFKTCCHC